MAISPAFVSASGYQGDELTLPVNDLDVASNWYCTHFGMIEAERRDQPVPVVILQRDQVRLGFAITGGDASQDGAAIRVDDIDAIRSELLANGVAAGDWRVDEQDDLKLRVFFVVAPDGLCFYFNEPIVGQRCDD